MSESEGARCCGDARCLYQGSVNSPSSSPAFSVITRQTREGEGLWERCEHCGLAINRSGVAPDKTEDYYNNDYVESHSYSVGEVLSPRKHFDERLETVRPIAESLRPYLRKDFRIFELGSATGELLYLLKDKVAKVYANDVMKEYIEFAKSELDIEGSWQDYFSLCFEEKFDLIIAINTVDHMYRTGDVISKIYGDLKPGGLFYIETPNDDQALNRYLPPDTQHKFREFMYQKAHFYSFSRENLKRLLVENGFIIEKLTSRHDYTLRNYLQWFFLGKPQKKLNQAMLETDLQPGKSQFDMEMNGLFADFDRHFRKIMQDTISGELLCVMARKPSSATS